MEAQHVWFCGFQLPLTLLLVLVDLTEIQIGLHFVTNVNLFYGKYEFAFCDKYDLLQSWQPPNNHPDYCTLLSAQI